MRTLSFGVTSGEKSPNQKKPRIPRAPDAKIGVGKQRRKKKARSGEVGSNPEEADRTSSQNTRILQHEANDGTRLMVDQDETDVAIETSSDGG